MNTLIVFAHPNPNSFNVAIKNTLQEELSVQGEVRVRDLYSMGFNPILSADDFNQFFQNQIPDDIKKEQEHLAWADLVVFLYPTWWINMPAILKGYIDRVFTNGFAFRYTENGAVGLLKDKKAIVIQTAGQPEEALRSYDLIKPMETTIEVGTLGFCGIETVAHKFLYSVPSVSNEIRQEMLAEIKELVKSLNV